MSDEYPCARIAINFSDSLLNFVLAKVTTSSIRVKRDFVSKGALCSLITQPLNQSDKHVVVILHEQWARSPVFTGVEVHSSDLCGEAQGCGKM